MLKLGPCWTCTTELPVKDIDAEVEYFCKNLSLEVLAHDATYALLKCPGDDAYVSFRKHDEEAVTVVARYVKICFMVQNLESVLQTLDGNNVAVSNDPELAVDSPFQVKWCVSPSGYRIEFWG